MMDRLSHHLTHIDELSHLCHIHARVMWMSHVTDRRSHDYGSCRVMSLTYARVMSRVDYLMTIRHVTPLSIRHANQ